MSIAKDNGIIAPNLKNIIADIGVKQSVIAPKIGLTEQQFSEVLNGRRLIKGANIEELVSVLKPFGVSANDLFKREGG